MSRSKWLAVLVVAFVCVPALAQQKDDEAVREKQRRVSVLIESLIADGRELKLPENRSLLLSRLGTKLWDSDRKRAEELFQQSITDLLSAQAEAEADKLRGRHSELLTSGATRPQVLRTIGERDADLALRSLYRTRPPAVERAMSGVDAKDAKIRNYIGNEQYLIQNEVNLEQYLARQAANQNPERAAELLRAVLKKGVTMEVLSLLRKVHDKDPALATELGSEAVAQVMRRGFAAEGQTDHQAMQTAFSFLNDHIQERPASDKSFRFAAADMRSLADKLIAHILDPKNLASGQAYQMIPIAEKIRPDAVEKLKGPGQIIRSRHGLVHPDPQVAKLLNNETPIEEVIQGASRLPTESRRQAYHNVANRLVSAGEVGRARQLIEENFSGDALSNARESMNWYYVHQLMNQGKFAEAEAVIAEFPDNNGFAAMISLANAVFNRNPEENKSYALSILNRAASRFAERPETSSEMQEYLRLISAYTRIEAPEAFRMFDGLVPQMNELTEASAVLNGFQGNSFRRGEMLLSSGNAFGVYIEQATLAALAEKDFDRTMDLISTFARRDMRIMLKQYVLDSLG